MTNSRDDRLAAARSALLANVGGGEYAATVRLFATHHLRELDAAYWERRLGTPAPDPAAVIGLLEPAAEEEEDDEEPEDDSLEPGGSLIDFTLPGGVTQYVLCVRFDSEGRVTDIAMES
ncbi:MAG: hypothetical protein AAF907_01150 [Planctomycetota bacterium]